MNVDLSFHLVSFATVTQQFQHLIILILSDGFRELQCPVCSALSLYDSMVVRNLLRGMRGVTGDPFFCYWVDLCNLWLCLSSACVLISLTSPHSISKTGWAYIRGRAGVKFWTERQNNSAEPEAKADVSVGIGLSSHQSQNRWQIRLSGLCSFSRKHQQMIFYKMLFRCDNQPFQLIPREHHKIPRSDRLIRQSLHTGASLLSPFPQIPSASIWCNYSMSK